MELKGIDVQQDNIYVHATMSILTKALMYQLPVIVDFDVKT